MEDVTTIGQIMVPAQDVIGQDEEIRMARRRLESEAKRSLIVVDGTGPVGVLEWRQIMRTDGDGAETPVKDVMTRAYPELTADMTLDAASERLGDVDVEMLPVVDESGALIGQVKRSALSHRESAVGQAQVLSSPDDHSLDGTARNVAAVSTGMTVVGASGSKIGEVSDVTVGVSGQLEAILVSHGLLGRKHKRVTADLVSKVEDDQVELMIDQPEFKALPDTNRVEENV